MIYVKMVFVITRIVKRLPVLLNSVYLFHILYLYILIYK